MFNDLSSPLDLLRTRRSGKPREFVGPGPNEAELGEMLRLASRVPDHGKLSPWRLVTVGADQRDALGILFRKALAASDPCASPAHHQAADDFAHFAGALVVLVSAPVPNHKIPVWEQELSCGAVAMNLLLAATAMGFVPGWLTGWYSFDETVRRAFCGEGERIAGFIFIGHPGRPLEERPRPQHDQIVSRWNAPAD
ncbi:nitroreductase [Sphingomonas ginkgonis]|uniref:Putative NAD(P)H nitroreductase n=1 Tax=Sphingomonas ginkgonis TaxID=2315330 RepID=A0A429VA27_9SPHN|nr:nitroreductase [Sphingomonas ginkgonis]RST30768.1 nitroreductase [Sphingomonas ginkgonis]